MRFSVPQSSGRTYDVVHSSLSLSLEMSRPSASSCEADNPIVPDLKKDFVITTAGAAICSSHQLDLRRIEGSTTSELSYIFTVKAISDPILARCLIDPVKVRVELGTRSERPVVTQCGLGAMRRSMNKLSWNSDEILSERALIVSNLHAKTIQCAETRLIYSICQKVPCDDQDKKRLDLLQPVFSFFACATTSAPWGRSHLPILESLSYPGDSLIFTFNAVPRPSIEPRCEVSRAISDLDMFQLEWLADVFKPSEHEENARDQLSRISLDKGEYGLELTFTVHPSHSDRLGSELVLDLLGGDPPDTAVTASSE